ncbi:MAG: flavin reductase family protein [Epsilonproteobacteria bacterium]|nr:flavin reductase family protein [Campylobacterota bacterium]
MEIIDFNKIEAAKRYELMAGNIIPRPIAWIVSEDENGIINVAPFSYFTGVASRPPLLMVSIGRFKKALNEPKDTFINIKTTKKATVCLVPEELKELMDKTAATLPHSVSEAQEFGIELLRLQSGFPPVIKGCKRAFFTTLYGTFENEEMATIPFFLKIEKMYLEGEFTPAVRTGGGYAKLC